MSVSEFLAARAKLNKAVILYGTMDYATYQKERENLFDEYRKSAKNPK